MRVRALLLPLLLFGPVALAATPTGLTLPWNTLDCEYVYAATQLPAAKLAPHLPPNWRPFSFGQTGTANLVATLVFEADTCAEGSGVSGQLSPMSYASTWSYILPPPVFRTDAPFTVYAWDILVPDDERRELLQSHHADVHDGAIALSESLRDGAIVPFSVEYKVGESDIRFDVVPLPNAPNPNPPPTGPAGEWDQYVRGSDGSFTYWRTFWTPYSSQQGVGVVTLEEDSWQAEAFGSTEVPARFFFGTWDYHDGRIVIPE